MEVKNSGDGSKK